MEYAFGDFILDLNRGELLGKDGPVPVEPRAFTLLAYMVEQHGRLVEKDELIASVWGGRIVSDAAIATAIKAARRALGDDGTEQTWLKTIRGRGFRFDGTVRLRAGSDVAIAARDDDHSCVEQIKSPRIAVLPFSYIGAQEHFLGLNSALPAEIIASLSRLRWIEVIARGSSFRFHSDVVDFDTLRSLLQVGYCLTGSVEASGAKVIVTVELSDTKNGSLVWADQFTTEIELLQQLRPRLVASVIAALDLYIPQHEAARARLLGPDTLDAWSNYHLGLTHVYRFNAHDNRLAEQYFERALELSPEFASAHAAMSFAKFQDVFLNLRSDRDAAVADVRRYAERALEIDPNDPQSNFAMGRVTWLLGAADEGLPWLETALLYDPNYARAFYTRGMVNVMAARAEEAIDDMKSAETLSPLDPLLAPLLGGRGLAQMQLGQLDTAVQTTEHAALKARAHHMAMYPAIIANAVAGKQKKAEKWRDAVLAKRPDATCAAFFAVMPFTDVELRRTIKTALVSSGLPTGE
ncbi:winged helix-turn-helix domain-containing tetratricopeptide repeat protein [Aestuariicoccus sp. MJ-SS9]|uniref:winged helix-turn-helix domain-containing tetratricopeptide repeat protein n=1 Tax=Aestuariicoccus sp. MJ-SS9 TaxID=3079855 RepID=UPI0029144E23|nr:winged helix-turn-helix domain-containing protein [Aestuariicoccus sp. MJ-SS9]MDU8914074.1 winged helix-turn-helix domain-containing protein [Aestuariicoccus sp. MJ-SS9]